MSAKGMWASDWPLRRPLESPGVPSSLFFHWPCASNLATPSLAFFSEGNLLGAVPQGHTLCTSGSHVYERILKWSWQQTIEVHGRHWLGVLTIFFLVEIFHFYSEHRLLPKNLQSHLGWLFSCHISHWIFPENSFYFFKVFSLPSTDSASYLQRSLLIWIPSTFLLLVVIIAICQMAQFFSLFKCMAGL